MRTSLCLLMLVAWCVACEAEKPEPKVIKAFEPIVEVKLGNQVFKLETARTAEQQKQGMMFRTTMADDSGMIFVYEPQYDGRKWVYRTGSMWMKNTYIPLDLVWVSPERKVIGIAELVPHDVTAVNSNAPIGWAIELKRGAADKAGLKVGDVIEIPKEAQHVADTEAFRP